jgi:hypothetical protein
MSPNNPSQMNTDLGRAKQHETYSVMGNGMNVKSSKNIANSGLTNPGIAS